MISNLFSSVSEPGSMLWISLDGMWIDAVILYKPLTLPLRHFQFFSQQVFFIVTQYEVVSSSDVRKNEE